MRLNICIAGACLILLYPMLCQAQVPNQTIRGQVTDITTGSSIPGVTVIVEDHEPTIGTKTDENGGFRLTGVPVGRQTLRFSYVGYESRFIRNIMVSSAREVVLNVALAESVTEMEEVVVRPGMRKDQPLNAMAISSARQLSMEEASRYAGGFDDPARLASSFTGVAGNMGDNAIVIRGNSPKGVLWQMEGVEIPTPSHFANIITIGGGGISALSIQMISDSDFYTGAFPAEYGNALSGVFDLNIRNGNNQNYEHTIKAGAIGIDLSSEGPLTRSGAASYLFNYRLSTFSLIAPLLPEDAANIRYHNLSYKFNIPTTNAGTFSFWGIGAADRSGSSAEESPDAWIYNQDRENVESPTRFGAAGFRHRLLVGSDAYLTTILAVSGNGFEWELDRYTEDGDVLYPREYIWSETGKLTAKTVLNTRISHRHTNRTGLILNRLGYNQEIGYSDDPAIPPEMITDESGTSFLYQAFSQSRFDLGRFSLTGGVYSQYFALINEGTLEPRLAVQFQSGQDSYSLSYGRHSQTEPLNIYFAHTGNLELGLAKADHLVAGYSRMINPDFRFNIEAYYQRLSNVPVITDSSFSVINMELDWFLNDQLVNDGAGRNYGLELTLERYLSHGWYALITGSLFDSQYRGGDRIWRNTRFNRGYTAAILGGREWEFRRENRVRIFSVNARLNFLGGQRISPVDEQRSHAKREVVYDETRAFSRQEPMVLSADLTLEYRTNRRNISSVWSLQLFNVTGYREFYGYRYNLREETIEEDRELILIPNLSYKIEF